MSALVVLGAIAVPSGGTVVAAPNVYVRNDTSTNWSGYVAAPGTFTSVSAQWTEPTVTCGASAAYSAFWVGIDGDTSSTVEQTGTDADCSGGSPKYYAWYEMYPKFPVNLSGAVHPGDAMTATVSTSGGGQFTLALTDLTAKWSFRTVQPLKRAKLASAEVIAEAPSGSGGVLPLANFGTVTFTTSQANGAALGSLKPTPLTMVTSGGATKAAPSALDPSGESFSVSWLHA